MHGALSVIAIYLALGLAFAISVFIVRKSLKYKLGMWIGIIHSLVILVLFLSPLHGEGLGWGLMILDIPTTLVLMFFGNIIHSEIPAKYQILWYIIFFVVGVWVWASFGIIINIFYRWFVQEKKDKSLEKDGNIKKHFGEKK